MKVPECTRAREKDGSFSSCHFVDGRLSTVHHTRPGEFPEFTCFNFQRSKEGYTKWMLSYVAHNRVRELVDFNLIVLAENIGFKCAKGAL